MSIVDFSATMQPSAYLKESLHVDRPGPDGQAAPQILHGAQMLLNVMVMPNDERMAILARGVEDPILILFALLTPDQRRGLVQSAKNDIEGKR
jgi:hypothetical protein